MINAVVATLVFISRLGFLPANVSPLGSYGFFSKNYLLFSLIIIIFDYSFGGFYKGFIFTYLGLAIYPLFGYLSEKYKLTKWLMMPTSSFMFFLISNFGVWLYWYEPTISDLIRCYTLALPFYTRTFIGDLGFGYGYMILKKQLIIFPGKISNRLIYKTNIDWK